MKVIKLTIDENEELDGIEAVALVEEPAIEIDFQTFSKEYFQSYNDYPQAARAAAEQGIKRNKALNNKCGTQVGKVRAQQLATGKNISLDTVKRMRAFLIRQRDNYDLAVKRKDYDACGYISYLLWGGPSALPWAEKKLRQAGILEKQNEEIIRDEMAKIGPRGGISGSPKAPKSSTPGEGKRGSKRNKPGVASTTRGVKVPARIEKSLQKKADDFNEKYKDKLGYGTSIAQLRTVYQRGVGAFQTSHSPKVRSAEQWAQARVNAYLYLVKNGRPQNKKYTADFDLLPSKHPKSNKQMSKFADIQMIDGIPVFSDPNKALEVSKMIGCEGVHEHKLEGVIYYMPCATHTEAIDRKLQNLNDQKYFNDLSSEEQSLLLKALDKTGKTAESLLEDGWVEMSEDAFHNHLYFAIVSEPEKGSLQDTAAFKVLYQYKGPRDSKNRDFCRQVLNKNLMYRLEDINNMSLSGDNQEFGTYDIFKYKGSYNCRHAWVQKFFRKETDVEKAKRSAKTNSSWQDVLGGPRSQQAAQVNPKSRTQAEVEAGVPEGTFEFSAVKGEEKILVGPLMVADKLIPRIDSDGNKYYVFFDEEGIRNLSYKMLRNKLIDSINIEHDPDRKVSDISLVESWLVEDPKVDKSTLYGYDLKKGSWMAKYKVNNQKIWDEYIKTGKVKGFSVEGIFNNKTIIANKE